MTAQNGNNVGTKNFGKVELAVVVSIISLIVSSIFAGYSVYLTNQANDLTKQANSIAEKSLNTQLIQSNFSSIVIPNTEPYGVFLDGGVWVLNATNPPITAFGFCNGSITVITPHYGTVRVEVENFTAQDYNSMLEPEYENLTTVTVDMYYLNGNQDLYAVAGVNQLDFSIPITALTYPNPQRMLQQHNNHPDLKTMVSIGVLRLNATFFDAQTNISTTAWFSARVSIIMSTVSVS